MKEVQSHALRELSATLERAYSCLDVVVLELEGDEPHDPESRHVLAVKTAFSIFHARSARIFLEHAACGDVACASCSTLAFAAYSSDDDKMRSEPITIAELVDERFYIATRRLAWEGSGMDSWPGFFWPDDAKIKRNRIFPEPA